MAMCFLLFVRSAHLSVMTILDTNQPYMNDKLYSVIGNAVFVIDFCFQNRKNEQNRFYPLCFSIVYININELLIVHTR